MSTEILKLNPPKMIALTINLAIVAMLIFVASSLIKSPPIIAKEIRIAHGSIVPPLLEDRKTK